MAENLEETQGENRQEGADLQKMADAEYAQMEQSMGYGKAPQAQKTAEEFHPPQLISAEPKPEKDLSKSLAVVISASWLLTLLALASGDMGAYYLTLFVAGPIVSASPILAIVGVVAGTGYERRTGKRSIGKIWCIVLLIVMLVLFIALLLASQL